MGIRNVVSLQQLIGLSDSGLHSDPIASLRVVRDAETVRGQPGGNGFNSVLRWRDVPIGL